MARPYRRVSSKRHSRKASDRTEYLRKLRLPLHPRVANAALDKVPVCPMGRTDQVRPRRDHRIRYRQRAEKHLVARWTLKSTYYWQQTFAAQQELVIDHRYVPSVGSSVETALGQDWAKEGDVESRYLRRYCPSPNCWPASRRPPGRPRRRRRSPFPSSASSTF